MKKIFLETMKTQQGRTGFYSMVIFTLALYPISLFFAGTYIGKVGMLACSMASFFGAQTFFQASLVVEAFWKEEENNRINGSCYYRRFLYNLSM